MPEKPVPEQDDPVTSKSLSQPLLISALVLVLTLIWGIADEVYFMRPWKRIQTRFASLYKDHLQRLQPVQGQSQEQIQKSPEYVKLAAEIEAARQANAADVERIGKELSAVLQPRLDALTPKFQEVRSQLAALTYDLETAGSEGSKKSIQGRIDQVAARKERLALPASDGSGVESVEWDFPQMEAEYSRLRDRKAQLQSELIQVTARENEARQRAQAYVREQMTGLTRDQIAGLIDRMNNFSVEIRQIHVSDINLVDRCESCHLGVREPTVLRASDMGGERAFASHPQMDLLKIHDPERFGCSPCHNGNGVATTSVEKAHGNYRHWLWPLFRKENMEAGCQQCHFNEIVTDYAETLNTGRELYRGKGCMGCHRYDGFDREPDQLQGARQQMRQITMERGDANREMAATFKTMDDPRTPLEELDALKARADQIRVNINRMDEQLEQLDIRAANLMREVKKVGPSLKEVRMKLRKEWIPVWIRDPHEFRPTTKMPTFRLAEEEIQALAAFVWQSGVEGKLAEPPMGNAGRGRELFETRGCMGCHAVGNQGGTFAANLSRAGEKNNYNYLVRWVHNPRERTRPYCALEKRDLGPEDYAKHGRPFVFDLEHAECPNDGTTLQVQQMTVMPSLRLTDQEARDIAAYLMTLRQDNAQYPAAAYLDDPELKAKGMALARNYGCAGCHEIAGLEDEGRIGTELTKEGSKPIERLDFALLTHPAEREGWYNHKGFFERKLEQPDIFDQGKVKPQLERLKMPNFHLTEQEIDALTTFLLGSVESQLPPAYFYLPEDQRRDIQEGWWIVRKYNCMGCHVMRANQQTVFMGLTRYQDPDWKEQMPPQLIGQGARVDPNWLVRFLANPALSQSNVNRNGVRTYLHARMPTFSFSEGEVDKLVRFFMALSSQATPYIQQRTGMEPLTEQERSLARQLFTSREAPCLRCHATGDPAHDARATAPNFLTAPDRLKPGWTLRWLLDPAMIAPGTAMPSGLFRREGERWVFNAPLPESFKTYNRDHAELLVRYMFQFTPEEARRLGASPPPN
jgi:cytochrome c551/c552